MWKWSYSRCFCKIWKKWPTLRNSFSHNIDQHFCLGQKYFLSFLYGVALCVFHMIEAILGNHKCLGKVLVPDDKKLPSARKTQTLIMGGQKYVFCLVFFDNVVFQFYIRLSLLMKKSSSYLKIKIIKLGSWSRCLLWCYIP